MSTATERLARYIAAETSILTGQEVRMDLGDRGGYKMLRMADLETVRQVIKDLQAEIRAEQGAASGVPTIGGLGYALANLSDHRL
jgi:hypothetical protein